MKRYSFLFVVFAIWGIHGSFAQTKPKCQQLQDKAYSEFQIGNFNGALAGIKKAIKCDPNSSTAYAMQAEIYETLRDSSNAIKSYKLAIDKDSLYQPGYFYYASYMFRLYRFDEALLAINQFNEVPSKSGFEKSRDGASPSMKANIERLKASVEMAKKEMKEILEMEIVNLGPNINTKANEYWPGMPINGKTFLFTRLVGHQEDFYISTLDASGWTKSRPLPGDINTPENEGTSSVYYGAKDQIIYFTVCNQEGYGSCDLFYSKLDDGKWGKKINLGPDLNTMSWEAQPSISGDGNVIVFASGRPGGYGGKDLWMSTKVNGRWSKPQNLGATINTGLDEEAPFLHYDGRTLYFSSSGHAGYGQHDIFMSRLSEEGKWETPINLGKGVNTPGDDVGFYVDALGKKAYFASDREGGFGSLDIYSIKLIDKFKPKPVNYLQCKIIDKDTKKPILAKVKLVKLNTGKVIYEDSTSGFLMPIVAGDNYALHSSATGYLLDSRNFQPNESTIEKPFEIEAALEKLKAKQIITLNNVFFDVDKFELRPESAVEIQAMFKLMQSNPKMKIEISGHTDNTGTEIHNKELSANRAMSVKSQLEKLGIEPLRITFKGMGSAEPKGSNETPDGRQLNRRIEVKILSL